MANPKKPNRLRALEGNLGNRPLQEEVEPEGEAMAPASLSGPAHAVWSRVMGSMPNGVYAPTDEGILAAYCEYVVEFETAVAAIELNGHVTEEGRVSPWVRIKNDAAAKMLSLGSSLGLTPTTRHTIQAHGTKKTENPFLK